MMVRIMIVLLLLGSAFLGWNYMQQEKVLKEYQEAIVPNGKIDRLIGTTQELAYKYTQFQTLAATEGKRDGGDGDSVFLQVQKVAQMPKISFGGLEHASPKTKENIKDYDDTTYRFDHKDAKQTVGRVQIANFFYQLERTRRRLKVTGIEVRTPGSMRESEIPSDQWDVEFDVTVREEKKKR